MRLLFEDAFPSDLYEISALRLRCFRGSRGRSSKRGPSDVEFVNLQEHVGVTAPAHNESPRSLSIEHKQLRKGP